MSYRPVLPRFRRPWATALQLMAVLCMVLQPLTVNSYWSDVDSDGDKDWMENPASEDSWWEQDSDGDLMTNAEEALYGSDPYLLDSDYDGLTDRDERDLTPPMIDGVTSTDPWLWDSDSDGCSDSDEYYNWLQGLAMNVNYNILPSGFTAYSYYDADGDGIHNPFDANPFDRDNDGIMDHEDLWPDDPNNNIQDDDGDGVANESDSHPNDSGFFSDWDGDGHNIGDDSHPDNSSLWSDSDGDGHNANDDSHPANANLWSDWNQDGDNHSSDGDEDGVDDGSDSHPHNAQFWDDWDSDGWSAGTSTPFGDSHSEDPSLWSDWDGNGINNDSDVDEDGYANGDDSHPTSTAKSTDWNDDGDNNNDDWDEDGSLNSSDSDPKNASLWYDWDRDGINDPGGLDDDGDGVITNNDSHPYNNSLWSDWNEDGDNNDTDGDEDGYANASDTDPRLLLLWCDFDRDGTNDPDVLDTDMDATPDTNDSHVWDSAYWSDWNNDGDNNDSDGDEDGSPNLLDSHPRNPSLWCDFNNDGGNDPERIDADWDSWPDVDDSHPSQPELWSDWNGNSTNNETDGDEDGSENGYDSHPRNPALWSDWNGNGENNDSDFDDDGWLNGVDSHPYNSSLWSDWDQDGQNNNSDVDNDGIPNADDSHPQNNTLWSDWNDNGSNNNENGDEDSQTDVNDSHPRDSTHWSDWNFDGDNNDSDGDEDGIEDGTDSHPRNVNLWSDHDNDDRNEQNDSHPNDPSLWDDWDNDGITDPDTDGDGIVDTKDNLPSDPQNGLDDDWDGLSNYEETTLYLTDPTLVDSDNDFLTDYEELLIFHTNPLDPITGETQVLKDGELLLGADIDSDGLPDLIEKHYALDAFSPDAATWIHSNGDLDADGVSNLQAYWYGWDLLANLNAYDQDGDGMTDAQEDYWSSLHPGLLDKTDFTDAVEDPDSDFLYNFEEIAAGFDPTMENSVIDNQEVKYIHLWEDGGSESGGDARDFQAVHLRLLVYHGTGFLATEMPFDQMPPYCAYNGNPITSIDGWGDHTVTVWRYRHSLALRSSANTYNNGPPGSDLEWLGDADQDGLTNEAEYINHTHPRIQDSDGDGLLDSVEVALGNLVWFDPNKRDSNGNNVIDAWDDFDGDGVNNETEITYGTDPLSSSDLDNDLMPRDWEIVMGLDPNDSSDRLSDLDGDRIPNLYEFKRGTHAADATSFPSADQVVNPSHAISTERSINRAVTDLPNSYYGIVRIMPGTYNEKVSVSAFQHVLLLPDTTGAVRVYANSDSALEVRGLDFVARDIVFEQSSYRYDHRTIYVGLNFGSVPLAQKQAAFVNCMFRKSGICAPAPMLIGAGTVIVDHCTFAGNITAWNAAATTYGSSIKLSDAFFGTGSQHLILRNSILWNPDSMNPVEIAAPSGTTVTATNNIIRGGAYGGVDADPLLDRYGHLKPGSPAIRSSSYSSAFPVKDIDGDVKTDLPDLGADEYVDADIDGLPDWWEIQYFSSITTASATDDSESSPDGLTNQHEYALGYNPMLSNTLDISGETDLLSALLRAWDEFFPAALVVDADGDGLTVGWEIYFGTSDTNADSNGDGIIDGAAWQAGINPSTDDADGDGLNAAAELAAGTNALAADTDGDGVNDNVDSYPLDPFIFEFPPGSGDMTAPMVALEKPAEAALIP